MLDLILKILVILFAVYVGEHIVITKVFMLDLILKILVILFAIYVGEYIVITLNKWRK